MSRSFSNPMVVAKYLIWPSMFRVPFRQLVVLQNLTKAHEVITLRVNLFSLIFKHPLNNGVPNSPPASAQISCKAVK